MVTPLDVLSIKVLSFDVLYNNFSLIILSFWLVSCQADFGKVYVGIYAFKIFALILWKPTHLYDGHYSPYFYDFGIVHRGELYPTYFIIKYYEEIILVKQSYMRYL